MNHHHLTPPVVLAELRNSPEAHWVSKMNNKFALFITSVVGTMWCAYAFAAIAFTSLPAALHSHDLTILIAWLSQTFIQLVLLSVIMVGQNLQAQAGDQRSQQTYDNAVVIRAEVAQLRTELQQAGVISPPPSQ